MWVPGILQLQSCWKEKTKKMGKICLILITNKVNSFRRCFPLDLLTASEYSYFSANLDCGLPEI